MLLIFFLITGIPAADKEEGLLVAKLGSPLLFFTCLVYPLRAGQGPLRFSFVWTFTVFPFLWSPSSHRKRKDPLLRWAIVTKSYLCFSLSSFSSHAFTHLRSLLRLVPQFVGLSTFILLRMLCECETVIGRKKSFTSSFARRRVATVSTTTGRSALRKALANMHGHIIIRLAVCPPA